MKFAKFAAPLAALFLATSAQAAVITLDFEGIGDYNPVGDFYGGGAGTDYGVIFSDNALALVDADAGGNGNFGNEPTPDTVLFFLTGGAATLNYAAGFTTGFSFYYTSTSYTGSVVVYDGLNATGNILATLTLPALGTGSGDPTGTFSNWDAVGVNFAGTAMSIDFSGTGNQIAFDNITFGSATPGDTGGTQTPVVPLPAGLPLIFSALAPFALMRRKRAKAKQA